MRLLKLTRFAGAPHLRTRPLAQRRRFGFERTETLLDRLNHRSAMEGAGDGDDHTFGRKVRIAKRLQRRNTETLKRRFFPENRSPQWLTRIERALVQFEDAIVRHIEGFAALLR